MSDWKTQAIARVEDAMSRGLGGAIYTPTYKRLLAAARGGTTLNSDERNHAHGLIEVLAAENHSEEASAVRSLLADS